MASTFSIWDLFSEFYTYVSNLLPHNSIWLSHKFLTTYTQDWTHPLAFLSIPHPQWGTSDLTESSSPRISYQVLLTLSQKYLYRSPLLLSLPRSRHNYFFLNYYKHLLKSFIPGLTFREHFSTLWPSHMLFSLPPFIVHPYACFR